LIDSSSAREQNRDTIKNYFWSQTSSIWHLLVLVLCTAVVRFCIDKLLIFCYVVFRFTHFLAWFLLFFIIAYWRPIVILIFFTWYWVVHFNRGLSVYGNSFDEVINAILLDVTSQFAYHFLPLVYVVFLKGDYRNFEWWLI